MATYTYSEAKKIAPDDLLALITSGEVTLRVNMAGTRPTFEEAKKIGSDDLLAVWVSGKCPDGTDFAGITAEVGGGGGGGGATAATGTIEFLDASFYDGDETIRIQDGATGDVTFTMINGMGGETARINTNAYNVDSGGGIGGNKFWMMAEFAYAVWLAREEGDLAITANLVNFTMNYSSSTFGVSSPVMDHVLLTNEATGTAGNIAIVTTNFLGTELTATGMAGGTA